MNDNAAAKSRRNCKIFKTKAKLKLQLLNLPLLINFIWSKGKNLLHFSVICLNPILDYTRFAVTYFSIAKYQCLPFTLLWCMACNFQATAQELISY